MKQFRTFFVVVVLLMGFIARAQNKVSGTVFEKSSNTPLPNAMVAIKGLEASTAVETDLNGMFELSTTKNDGKIVVTFFGFKNAEVNFSFVGKEHQIDPIYLEEEQLDEIVVMARGVIDVADGRKTPIAVSTIKRTEIEEKVGARDITAALVNTPSVYVVNESSGFGDTQMYTRGFDQSNTAFLLNGQPINGMEDGNMYWSNWSGMSDIANAIQIQRGLGSSKLAISSVGGTINFITKATEMKAGGFINATMANNAFFKTTLGGSTGLMKNGFGVTALFSHWQGDGYNQGTQGQGQNYFISLGYKVNDKHNLNFLITGAPQWHNQNFAGTIANQYKKDREGNLVMDSKGNKIISSYGYEQFGRRYNSNWGYFNGEVYSERKNYYHKPVANLNWDWTISDKSNLSTVLYASWGRGGGTGPASSGGRFNVPVNPETGLKDFDAVFKQQNGVDAAKYAIRGSVNNHQWYGMVSNFNHKFTDELTFNVGADLRFYTGDHFRQIVDMFGAKGFIDDTKSRIRDPKNLITQEFTTDPWSILGSFAKNAAQKYNYDYSEQINYQGVFTQLEYATENFSAFFQGSLSNQSTQRWDYYQYKVENEASEKISKIGYNVKGGISYNIDKNHFFFGNAGYYSRQPFHDNIFMNYKNDVNPFAENEKILGLEVGYKYTNEFILVNINAYKTTWKNRIETSSKTIGQKEIDDYKDADLVLGQQLFELNRGVGHNHMGVEIDVMAKVLYNLEVNGFASFGNWQYSGNARTQVTDEQRNIIKEKETDLDGGKVGNAAQTTFGFGAKYKITPRLSVDANYRYYANLYADKQEKDNLKLPSYNLVDAGVSYRLQLTERNALSFRLNINNVFNEIYISNSRTAIKVSDKTTKTYKGIDANNQVYFGFGRTWSASVKFTF